MLCEGDFYSRKLAFEMIKSFKIAKPSGEETHFKKCT